MNHIVTYIIITLLALATAACSSGNDEPQPAPATGTQAPPPGDRRTILIYMVASNSLGTPGWGYDNHNLDQMTQWAAANDLNGCNVVVYHVVNTSDPRPTLSRLTPDGFVTEKEYESLGDDYATDPEVMARVLDDVRRMYPARESGIIFWSHGLAWVEDEDTITEYQPRWWGEDRGRKMSVRALAGVLGGSPGSPAWDFLYFDSCYAANIEMVYEMRHAAPRIIGSTTEVQGAGMPYDLTLTPFTADRLDCEKIADTTFRHYDAMSGIERSCTMSVIDTSGLDRLAAACRAILAGGARTPASYRPIPYAVGTCYSFDMADYYHAMSPVSADMMQEFDEAFSSCVLYHAATPMMWQTLDLSRYSGLGCYVISSSSTARRLGYENQQWWIDVMSTSTFITQ